MILGTGFILAALCFYIFNRYEAHRAGVYAEEIQAQLKEAVSADGPAQEGAFIQEETALSGIEIDGSIYIGYLTIPTLELELPVMDDWDYKKLKVAPCRYYGSTATNDLVVAAHNYDRHFGRLGTLAIGDPVYFTDMSRRVFEYQVKEVTTMEASDVVEMTSGDYDLTLFTCTYGGKSRVAVRCERRLTAPQAAGG